MINDHWTLIIGHWTLEVANWNRWNLHPSVVAGLVLLGGLYVFLGGLTSARRQVASFFAALVVLFFALNGPLHNLSDNYLFSAHMAQHLLLTLVFPPLLLYGTPAHLVRLLLRHRWVMAVARVVTRPLAAASIFTAPILVWHVPVLGGLMLWIVMTVIWFRWSFWDARGDAERAVPLDAYGVGGSGLGTGRN